MIVGVCIGANKEEVGYLAQNRESLGTRPLRQHRLQFNEQRMALEHQINPDQSEACELEAADRTLTVDAAKNYLTRWRSRGGGCQFASLSVELVNAELRD